jgi:hypothetical protein
MKAITSRRASGYLLFALATLCCAPALLADVVVDTSLSLTTLQISATGYSVEISGVTASAFASVFDALDGPCSATGSVTVSCAGFDSGSGTASATASQGAASASGDADASALTANASSHVNIPGALVDTAGTNASSPYGDLAGTLEILDSSSSGSKPVTINFSAALSGSQSLFMDSSGLSATSEVVFNLLVNGSSELFLDSPLALSAPGTIVHPISTTLKNSDSTLLTNTPYSFDAQVDAESFGANTPEPSFFVITGMGLLALPFARALRRRDRT